ncbi:MAG: NlpC/P60 family protein [Nostocoides sp.]
MVARRWSRRVLVAMAAAVALLWPTAAAADYTFYRTAPHTGACWKYVSAYGGVYQVTSVLLNGTSATHTARVQVYRPGTGIIQDHTQTATASQWKVFPIAHVAAIPKDEFRYYLNGALVVKLPAAALPYYMNNCQTTESSSVKIRQAISYGMSKLDAHYTGCNASSYRMGGVAAADMWFDGSSCGQKVYLLPKGHAGFDCSGLIYKMFQAAGVPFSYQSSAAMAALPAVSKSQIRVGDLLVNPGHHVAMYLGDGDGDGRASVLEATPARILREFWSGGKLHREAIGVVISDAGPYLSSSAYTARRVPGT